MPVENSNVPTNSSDKWMKVAHLNELTSITTRAGAYMINPLASLPQIEPDENYYSGSVVQKTDHEGPVESADKYFQLMLTDEIIKVFVSNTNSYAKSTGERYWNDLFNAEFKTFMSICL
jgi:hypothetical protein